MIINLLCTKNVFGHYFYFDQLPPDTKDTTRPYRAFRPFVDANLGVFTPHTECLCHVTAVALIKACRKQQRKGLHAGLTIWTSRIDIMKIILFSTIFYFIFKNEMKFS